MTMAILPVWIIMALIGSSGAPVDSVSLLDPEDYFQTRSIDVKVDKLIELAGKDPSDGRTQIAQLLAIRWLGEHAAEAKKDKSVRPLLEQIAAGKKAQDSQGFAKEYAERALALFDGKTPPVRTLPENSMREALAWFPEGASYFGGIDMRGSGEKLLDDDALRKLLSRNVPPMARQEIYKAVDSLGNLRIDRISFAYRPDANNERKDQIYIRVTGKGDPKRVAAFFRELQNGAVKEDKGPKGLALLLIEGDMPPVVAIAGDSDIVFAGYEHNSEKHQEVMQRVLDIIKDGKPSIVTSVADLKKVPANACGLLMGDVPERTKRTIAAEVLPALPRRLQLDATRGKDIVLRVQATMDNADDAKKLADKVEELKKQGSEGLKMLPPQIKIKQETIDLLTKALSSLKVEPKAADISGGLTIPGALLKALPQTLEELLKKS